MLITQLYKQIILPNPSPMVYNDRLYLYTSHDDDVTEKDFYTMRDYYCYSTTDLVNWTNHGIIDAFGEFKWTNLKNGAWTAQCVEHNGKIYLYVPINGVGIGVLVADKPDGPFKDPIGKLLIGNHQPWSDIDPTVFIDTDGQVYMYWGNCSLWYVKLNENMVSYSGSIGSISPLPSNYTEEPWFYKRDDLYYMAYAGMEDGSENLRYATSASPIEP